MSRSIHSPKQSGFSQKQLVGVLILSIIVIACVATWRLWPYFNAEPTTNITNSEEVLLQSMSENNRSFSNENDRTTDNDHLKNSKYAYNNGSVRQNVRLFPFNPNTASEEDFINLGLSPRVAATIIKYRSKGGYFRDRDDFSKIYTLSQEDFQRLKPYVNIPARAEPSNYSSSAWKSEKANTNNFDRSRYSKTEQPVNLNSCNESDLMQLRGIGPAYAGRIIKYRDLLGGYHAVEQLKEVYGMNDSLYGLIKDKMIIEPTMVKQININKASEEEFYNHPYIKRMAKNIILYRNDIGQFKNLEEFRAVPLINEEKYRKIAPYLTL